MNITQLRLRDALKNLDAAEARIEELEAEVQKVKTMTVLSEQNAIEVQKERLSGLNHRLSLCMKEIEIIENERAVTIQKIRILESIGGE
jgi:hypothetical protein